MRWTRQRRARKGIAGRIELRERLSGVQTDDAANCLRRNWPDRCEVRRELWRDGRGRRNRVVPTPPGWRQVVWRCIRLNRAWRVSSIRKATVAKVQGSPRRSPISRNPSCRESRMIRFTCGPLVRFLCTTAGAIGARLSLRPSFLRRVKLMAYLGRIAPRECGRISRRDRHCEEPSCPPKPAFGRRRMRRSNPTFFFSFVRKESWIASLRSQ